MSWTFLSNHGHVVVQLSQNPELKVSELAQNIGVTERHVRSVLLDLRDAGYLEVVRVGRQNRYKLKTNLPLRHDAESNKSLRDLVAIFSPKRRLG